MLRELLKCSILTSVVLTGCNTMPTEDNSSVLMEDVIVERTTVRSTTQNPKPKQGSGGVYISGDNINIGTIIVNSPGAKVDNSTTTNTQLNQTNQQQNNSYSRNNSGISSRESSPTFTRPPEEPAYHTDRDFFKNLDSVFFKLVPSILMGHGF